MSKKEDMLTLEDSVLYVRGHFKELYPKGDRSTMGHIPVELHTEISEYAITNNLKMHEVISGLWDFNSQYELEFAKDLKEQRNRNKSKSTKKTIYGRR